MDNAAVINTKDAELEAKKASVPGAGPEMPQKKKTLVEAIKSIKSDKQFANDSTKMKKMAVNFILFIFKFILIVGICYVILSPLITIVSHSFFSDDDYYSPIVYIIPIAPTLARYSVVVTVMGYFKVLINSIVYDLGLMIIQIIICSMVGYGFARFDFPFKKLLFGCVIAMIVIPTHTIMLPLYMTFRKFSLFGIIPAITGSTVNLLSTPVPIYLMTIFGCGLRSGLYIYIFVQFFRGLPKEIEEAAFVDGAGMWYTYYHIMLINAVPSIITVAIFSLVWQYNDTFYANLFLVSKNVVISKNIVTLMAQVSNIYKIYDPAIAQLYLDAGVVLTIIPVIVIYIALQKYFVEGVERSGIVG